MNSERIVYDYPVSAKNVLITIYTDEIKQTLKDVPYAVILAALNDYFDNSEKKRINVAATLKGENAGKDQIYALASKAQDARIFLNLVNLVSNYDPALANKLRCVGVHDCKRYPEVLASFQYFTFFDIDFIRKLTSACKLKGCFGADIDRVILSILEYENDSSPTVVQSIDRATAIMIQQLPRYNQDWYWKFMKALETVPNGVGLRDMINPNYADELEKRGFEPVASALDTMTVLGVDSSFENWLNGDGANVQNNSMDNIVSGADSSSSLTNGTIQLRNYQIELASAAIRGQNAVICAPTGSGKTFVAAEIIRCHFANVTDPSAEKKVAFLVPTVQLVDQQYDVMMECLPSKLKLKKMTGGSAATSATPKVESILANDLIVTTPQVLLNLLRNSRDSNPVKLSTFTMMIMDECHHTDNDHPYNEMMLLYLDTKFGRPPGSVRLPQIVGLTASLGVGKADTDVEALQHVVHVSANMDANVLSTISDEHQEELAKFVYVPKDRVVPVKEPPRPLTVLIQEIMSKIEAAVANDFKRIYVEKNAAKGTANDNVFKDVGMTVQSPATKPSQHYEQWVCKWLWELPKFNECPTKPALTSALEHLRIYHKILDLVAHVPSQQALRKLNGEFEVLERKQSSERDRKLVNFYKQDILAKITSNSAHYLTKNDLVEKLTEILINEFKLDADARVLVFVRTRDLTMALEEFMQNDDRLKQFNASRFTGSQAATAQGGQTTKEQQDILQRFRDGQHRILIATTVAEEGVDVQKCHLVIKYNHVTNEIAMVQRRGRGRAVGSESILLVQDDWIHEKELTNILREILMLRAVKTIRQNGDDWFRRSVVSFQEIEYRERARLRAMAEAQRQALAAITYDMLCKKCDASIVSTTNMRRIASCHYVAIDPNVWKRLFAEPDNNPRIFETMVQGGKVSCRKCRSDCGIVIRYSNTYLPALKIDALSLKRTGVPPNQVGERLVKRKWIQATKHFNVDPLEDSDLREMFTALDEGSKKRLDHRIEQAQARAVVLNELNVETGGD